MQHRHTVFPESRFQYPIQFVVGNTVEQEFLFADTQIQLVFEGDTCRIDSGFSSQFLFNATDCFRFGGFRFITGVKFRHHIRFTRHKEFLKYRFRRRERNDRERITFLQFPVYRLFQRGNSIGSLRTEIKFRFGRRQFPFPIENEILSADRGCLLQYFIFQFLEKFIHPSFVFIHMDILIPFYPGDQFIFLDIGHPFFVYKEKEEYAKRNGNHTEQYTERFMAKYPVNTRIIEAVQRVILDRVIKFERKPLPFPGADTCPVNQQIKYGKQHDTGEIRHHQSYSDRKSLIKENSACNTAHKNQRGKDSNSRQRRAQHGGDHFTGSRHTGTAQGVSPFTVLRYILSHNNRTVNHHSQCQDQSGKRNDIERHIAKVEKDKADHDGHHHTESDNQRRLYISQKQNRYQTNKEKAQGEILLQIRDGVVQQFRLITADAEIDLRVY